jgi:hypothetical protein
MIPLTLVLSIALRFLAVGGGDSPADWVRALPPAGVEVHPDRHEIVIELAPMDLPGGMHHDDMAGMAGMSEHHAHNPVFPPVMGVDLPFSGWMSGFRVELVDGAGDTLPSRLLHHYNLIDPSDRELFLPISRRVLAAGSETGPVSVMRWLMGAPFTKGKRLVASAMLHNPTPRSYKAVRTRLIISYTDSGHWYPLLRAYPWQFDVAFPVGDKSFDLPPGRSERQYEGSPAIPGKIIAIGGHAHDYAEELDLIDLTSGDTLWHATPIADSTGHVLGMPRKKFIGLTGIGVSIERDHRYRVAVVYENTTGDTIPDGGMGVVGGLFRPDSKVEWPAADQTDSLYIRDLRHALRLGPEAVAEVSIARRDAASGESTRH